RDDGEALVPPPEPSVPTVAEHAPDDATTLGGDTRREHARPSVPRPTPSRRPPGSADSGASSRSIAGSEAKPSILTTGDAIQHQDIDRARSFLRIAVVVCVLVAAPVWWLGGDAWAQRIFFGAMIVCALASAYVAWRLRDARAYTPRRILGIGLVLVAGAFTGIVYTGVFSAAAGVIPFGLFFFGLSRWSPGTLSVYLTCAVGYALVAGLIAFGAFPDPGIMSSEQLRLGNKLAIIGLAEVFFFATFSVSRRSYRAAAWALEQHEHAVRDLAAREALLKEARLDLEGALRARGLGRFTDEIVGAYRLGTILGRGGMGEVYDAVHCDTEEQAAVKLLHAEVLRDPDGIRRFLRECQAASKLDVPNVVRVIATSEPSAPIPFIAMERLHGDDLADHLRAVGRMELEDVVTLVHQVGAGLDAARAAGIVHRDIKPRNLFRAEQGNGPPLWKILDFGVSKLVSEATLTKKDMVGTPSYMAPEQASGGVVSHRTDLFALGVIAYRALTGRPAFSGDLVPQILYQVVHVMPPRPSLVVRLPSDVDRVLALALAKDPKDRFDSGAEMAQALEAAARRRLAPELRARADELLSRAPWSKT
ncbi:MAG: protein kinase, partial [Polyangiaceae bacterium]|nr:protein kinase [Polyangiaceae bacterium]